MAATNDEGLPVARPKRLPAPAGSRLHTRLLLQGLLRTLALWSLVAIPPLILLLDIQWLGNSVGEWSLVEASQLVLLIANAAAFAALAHQRPGERRFAVLAAAFFACMAIRETDAVWDLALDGLWQVMVAAVALAAVAHALADWRTTLRGLARFITSRPGLLMAVALGILLVHSRLLGMGMIWEGLLDEQYLRVFKNAVEETTELLAYVLITASSVVYLARRLDWSRPGRRHATTPDKLEATC